MAIFAMEDPVSLNAEDIRNEKVKVLRSIRPINIEDVVLGQYKGRSSNGVQTKGYLEDPTVPEGSLCPTFAAIAYHIDNARWDGVPFLMKAGKALDKRCAPPHTRASARTLLLCRLAPLRSAASLAARDLLCCGRRRYAEIRVQFRHVPGNLYKAQGTMDDLSNELVIRIQPDEAVYLKINNKVPGARASMHLLALRLQEPQAHLCRGGTPTHGDRLQAWACGWTGRTWT